eukprot:1107993-Alexandrium_andersonii.AAC.1
MRDSHIERKVEPNQLDACYILLGEKPQQAGQVVDLTFPEGLTAVLQARPAVFDDAPLGTCLFSAGRAR